MEPNRQPAAVGGRAPDGSALDTGINFLDTADAYADGRSELITGQALKNLKCHARTSSCHQGFSETGTKAANSRGMSRFHIMKRCRQA